MTDRTNCERAAFAVTCLWRLRPTMDCLRNNLEYIEHLTASIANDGEFEGQQWQHLARPVEDVIKYNLPAIQEVLESLRPEFPGPKG